MRSKRITGALLALALVSASACTGGDRASGGDRHLVVAAFYPLAYVAERIGGDRVEVVDITPAGTEPHDLELTADQVDQLEDAALVVYAGGGFQPAVEEAVERREGASVDAVAVAGLGGSDPHVWLDPDALANVGLAVAQAMAELDPAAETDYLAAAEELEIDLLALDDELRSGLADCERRVIVTAHAAFGHLAARYGLEQLAISGLSPESEPDPARLDELAAAIEARGVTTVFYEELVSREVAETLAREVGVETAVLNPVEGLRDEQVERGEDYMGVMRANLTALREALECS